MTTETFKDLEERMERFQKERELKFKQAKENITFVLRGDKKYCYAFQCEQFQKNCKKYGFDHVATAEKINKEGLLFNKYSITLGHYYGHDLKRFNSKEEMLSFVDGYNEAIYKLKEK